MPFGSVLWEDCFQMLALQIREATARLKDDMKQHQNNKGYNWTDGETRVGQRELQAKLVEGGNDAAAEYPKLDRILSAEVVE